MPTSNDTRVRVEGFSKIIASVLPSSGLVGCLMRLQLRLHGDAGREHVAQLLGRQLAEIEKMPQRLAHCPAACFN